MNEFVLLFILSAIGIGETSYLVRTRKAMKAPVCPIGGSCHTVLSSMYSATLGIHNDLLGLMFYGASAITSIVLALGIGFAGLLQLFALAVLAAALMSLYLTFLQWQVIKAWCFWCVMSACTIWLMALILFFYHVS